MLLSFGASALDAADPVAHPAQASTLPPERSPGAAGSPATTVAREPNRGGAGEAELHMAAGLDRYREGDLEQAGAEWLAAAEGFAALGEREREATALLRASQARSALGFAAESRQLLERAFETAPAEGAVLRATILGALAENLLVADQAPEAAAALERALGELRGVQHTTSGSSAEHESEALEARLQRTRGDLLVQTGQADEARDAYRRSEALAARAGDALLVAQSVASLARSLVPTDANASRESLARALQAAATLPASDEKARLLIHVGSSWTSLAETAGLPSAADLEAASRAFASALAAAEASGSRESASFALGHLGALQERYGSPDEAIVLTQRALGVAQPLDAPELRYRWQWQLARLYRQLGDDDRALVAFRRAAALLDEIRAANAGAGLAFASEVEPVYYGLVDLLLASAARAKTAPERTALLGEAQNELEALKSAELVDYFEDPCVAPAERTAASAIPGAAIIYPVVLADRTELIVSRAGEISSVVVPISGSALDEKARAFRELLTVRSSRAYLRPAAELYDLLIRPIEAVLGDPAVETLVFVPGGSLRQVPMAALYDREQRVFLIEKRPIAVIPALTLTEPRGLDRERVNTLRAGLTEAVQGFSALAAVGSELESVQASFGGRSLVDAEFVAKTVEQTLGSESFGIVHIATHGQFSARSDESFLLTFDGRIGLEELAQLVGRTRYQEEPIELLTLSACETAVGDDRAALGLAGVAVRAGARSALATLWTVNDQASADLVAEFYRQLAIPGTTKARALQQAQISLLSDRAYRHPGYWAAFLMISNWM